MRSLDPGKIKRRRKYGSSNFVMTLHYRICKNRRKGKNGKKKTLIEKQAREKTKEREKPGNDDGLNFRRNIKGLCEKRRRKRRGKNIIFLLLRTQRKERKRESFFSRGIVLSLSPGKRFFAKKKKKMEHTFRLFRERLRL